MRLRTLPAQRVLLLIPTSSYRATDFLEAARRLGVEVVVGSDQRHVLEAFSGGRTLTLDFREIDDSTARIVAHARQYPLSAVVGTDDATVELAATASKALGLSGNAPASVAAARDKHIFRTTLARARLRSPWVSLIGPADDASAAAARAAYPCVLKPLGLAASRGVIRVDNAAEFAIACGRIRRILATAYAPSPTERQSSLLVEGFMPGREVALEGLLMAGRLKVLALFDKPDPLDGPFFEETIYVTPARVSTLERQQIQAETEAAAAAIGLAEGPVHAELRLNAAGAWMIEIAARSIGGLCSRTLRFGRGLNLEELILRHSLGLAPDDIEQEADASGVMMIPIPAAGRLEAVNGLEMARRVPGVSDVVITIPPGELLVPLPEGDRYLGFIFARARESDAVEQALRRAHAELRFEIAADSAC